jgi:predicted Zn-dependent peptidase
MSVLTFTYPNGFRLVYEKTKSDTSNIQVFCDVGSIHEPDDLRGVSHMVEHMCFKGTTHRRIPKSLHTESDKIGAYMNAYTEKSHTCYMVKCDNLYTENMTNLLSDMILNSIFDGIQFKIEEKVVIEESTRNTDDPLFLLFSVLNQNLYAGSAYEPAIDMLEYHNTLFNRDKVVQFYKDMYRPERMILSVVTSLSFDTIKRMVLKSFFVKNHKSLSIPRDINYLRSSVSAQSEPYYNIVNQHGSETVHIAIGFRTDSADRYLLKMLQLVLSGPNSSRMFVKLREENGLTYTSSIDSTSYEQIGDFTFYAQADASKVIRNGRGKKGVLPIILDIISDICTHGLRQSEIDIAKGYYRGQLHNNFSDGTQLCGNNGLNALFYPSEPICPYSKLYDAYYDGITREELNMVARKYMKLNNMTLCMVGKKAPKLSEVKAICQSTFNKG